MQGALDAVGALHRASFGMRRAGSLFRGRVAISCGSGALKAIGNGTARQSGPHGRQQNAEILGNRALRYRRARRWGRRAGT